MMWFAGTHSRRHHTCAVCGKTAPLDAIRLRGGRFYCPQGECRRLAERLIREAQERLKSSRGPAFMRS